MPPAALQKVLSGHLLDPAQQGIGRAQFFWRCAMVLDLFADHLPRDDHLPDIVADLWTSRLEIDQCLLATGHARFRLRQSERAKAPLIVRHQVSNQDIGLVEDDSEPRVDGRRVRTRRRAMRACIAGDHRLAGRASGTRALLSIATVARPDGVGSHPSINSSSAGRSFRRASKSRLTSRRRRKAVRPKQAKGLTRDYLDRFLRTEPETPWGLRNRAMLSLGYELMTRRSELVALRTDDLEERRDGTFRVLIRRSKSDPFGQGRIAFTSEETGQRVRDWLDWRGPGIDWLFCPIYRGKPVNRDLSTTTVKRLVKNAAKRVGLDASDVDAFSGHSMRVGAAQDLLAKGFDTAAIMRAGGWKSVNVLARYLENAEHNVWAS